MKYILILIYSLIIIIPNVIAALGGECSGLTGICINNPKCQKFGGKMVHQRENGQYTCPYDPEGIDCCQDIKCVHEGVTGKCVFTYECDDEKNMVSGLCPGGNDFKCCLGKVTTEGVSYSYQNVKEKQQNTNRTKGTSIDNSNTNLNNINIESQDKNDENSSSNYLYYVLSFIGGIGFATLVGAGTNFYIKSKLNKKKDEITKYNGSEFDFESKIPITGTINLSNIQPQNNSSEDYISSNMNGSSTALFESLLENSNNNNNNNNNNNSPETNISNTVNENGNISQETNVIEPVFPKVAPPPYNAIVLSEK
eukprot:jgi/Orpsp1_1/1182249/evm.model.c7180000080502.1